MFYSNGGDLISEKNYMISFVRHAESCGNVGIFYENEYHKDDPPLSEYGLIQANCLADNSIVESVTKIYSSSLIRAVQTAYPTSEKLNLKIMLLPDLMEIGTRIPGTDLWRLKENYPLAVPFSGDISPTGAAVMLGEESVADLVERGKRCISFLENEAEEGDHIMVVTHGSFFGYLLRAALGIELPEKFCWQVDNCSITRVIFRKDNIPKLSFANSVQHLK